MTYASSLANLMRTIGFDYNGGLLIEGIGMPTEDAPLQLANTSL